MAFTFNLAPPRVGVPERDWSFMDTIMQRREDRKAGEAAVQSAQGLTPEQIEQVTPLLKNRQTMPEGLRMIREWRKPADLPNSVQEYQYGLKDPAFAQHQLNLKRAGGTNVNVGGDNTPGLGKLSSDYGYVLDPETRQPIIDPDTNLPRAAPIPGSPAWKDQQKTEAAAGSKEEQQKTWNTIVNQDIGRAIDVINKSTLPTTGFWGDMLSSVGGTGARDLRGLIDTIKANAGFDRLQAMRDSSPTGGALGQVSERELAFLQSTIGSLEQSQGKKQITFNLKRVQKIYQNMLEGRRAYDGLLDEDGGGSPPSSSRQTGSGVKYRVLP